MRGVFVWFDPCGLFWLPFGGRRSSLVVAPSGAFGVQGPVLAFPTWGRANRAVSATSKEASIVQSKCVNPSSLAPRIYFSATGPYSHSFQMLRAFRLR